MFALVHYEVTCPTLKAFVDQLKETSQVLLSAGGILLILHA